MTKVFDVSLVQEVFETLRHNRLRAFLTACGIFWGVFVLVIVLGFSRGLEKAAHEGLGFFAHNTLSVRTGPTGLPYAGRPAGRRIQLTLADVEALNQVPGIELAIPRNFLGQLAGVGVAPRVSRGRHTERLPVRADLPEYLSFEGLVVEHGRFLNPADTVEARKVAVIGSRARALLFDKTEDPIGKSIWIANSMFVVVGLHHTAIGGQRGQIFNGRIFIPRPAAARVFSLGDRVDSIDMRLDAGWSSDEVEGAVHSLLKERHRVHPSDQRPFIGINRERPFRKVSALFFAVRIVGWVVGILTLLAGAIGVSNIMMITVAERTREIGIRRALGATPAAIMFQIVAEAALLTSVAGCLGLCAGVALVEFTAHLVRTSAGGGVTSGFFDFAPPELHFATTLLATLVLLMTGLLAGVPPARAAISVRPVEALAEE